jgi:hypothetical protein
MLLMALSLPAVGHLQTSQKYYFGEGQSTPQSGRATSHNRHHTKQHLPYKNQYSHP